MLLFIGASLWLLILLATRFWPGLARDARRERQIDLAAIGIIGLATLGFFWRLIFSEDVSMPAGGGDLAGFLFPTYHFAAEWWRRGVIPLWNPHLFGGAPFVGDIQSGLLYPLNLLTFFLSNPLAYRDLELLAVLHFFIAGAGMYALLRFGNFRREGLPLARAACLAGAVTFEFSDLFITHFGNLNLVASAAWLPLIFLFFGRALDSPNLRIGFAALAGIFLALAVLAGHVQPLLFILIALGLYAVYTIVASRRAAPPVLAAVGITLLVGLGLSAPTLLPGIELARASVRSVFSYDAAAQFSLPPVELVGLLVPGFFGRGPQAAWGPWPRVEVGYLGVMPLILAALALVLRRDSKTLFFALLALVGLLLALGGYTILHGWLYAVVPGFGQLRAPARFIFLLDFALSVLAALAFDALLYSAQARARLRFLLRPTLWIFLLVAMVSGGVALSILVLGQGQDPVLFARISNAANSLAFFILLLGFSFALISARARELVPAQVWSPLALALILFDLFSLGAYVDVGLGDPTAMFHQDDVIDFVRQDAGFFRIDSRTDVEGVWSPDTALVWGLYDVNGDNPLILSNWDRYWESLGSRAAPAYDALNIKYVIARRSTPLDQKFKRVFDGAAGLSVYENPNALPRAWLVYASRVVAAPEQALEQIHAAQFDPHAMAILNGAETLELAGNGMPSDPAQIVNYNPNELSLEATAKQEGYLVLSEVYDAGWRAFVDGREAPVARADYLFRAVLLEPGTHRVRFFYDPLSFKLGAVLSGLTLAGMVGGAILWALKHKT